jgi:hypothetical protein
METESTAWEQTLKLLAHMSSSNGARGKSAPRLDHRSSAERFQRRDVECGKSLSAFVSILERSSPTEVRICWCDATTGRYGDQRWRVQMARSKSVCALSGAAIRRGDLVYRPWVRGENPWNAKQSILVDALAKLENGAD